MKVLIIGGYGVFGARLAELLVKDGHTVCVAGRNLKSAEITAKEIGCSALRFDRSGDLSGLSAYDVVVDAAGPFHSYGDNPYRLAETAVEQGVHYLDFSDNAEFCAGIDELDEKARQAGVCVLSGLSTVPALSSAAVTALVNGETPTLIDSAILPGNKSPRGVAVMASILNQTGQPISFWQGNAWQNAVGWSNPQTYELPNGLKRQAWQTEVPDNRLFPEYFKADTVVFRAGLELGVMRWGLAVFSKLRTIWSFPVDGIVLRLAKFFADLLQPFGTGRGGMSVMAIVGEERRYWRLLIDGGKGPYIPAVAARALLRQPKLPIGAGVALDVISLEEAEAAMADLGALTEQVIEPIDMLFPKVLGASFSGLPDVVQVTHKTKDKSHWKGRASVGRGTGLWPRLLAALFQFPAANDDIEVDVTKTVTARGETWLRRFGGATFKSHLKATNGIMSESFFPFTFLLDLKVKDAALHFPVKSGRLGPIPLPKWLLPVSIAKETAVDGRFHFDVELRAPLTGGLMVHYKGYLEKVGV
ncbi:MAG: DUF4166 domain-containing protein [Hyphomicrobiales bacterium]